MTPQICLDFDGKHFDREKDGARLSGQIQDVYAALRDGKWKTVEEIEAITGHPQNSISAQIRNLRKEKFGGHNIPGRYREGTRIFEYRLEAG